MDLLNAVSETLTTIPHFSRGNPLLLGISGGPDSLCLFDILVSLGIPFSAAHLNHNLRPGAFKEAETVQALVKDRGVPWIAGSEDVRSYARSQHLSLEEAGRILRYRFLFEQANRIQARAVLVAHHADDQVETILMHFLRGAGLQGLLGMPTIGYLPVYSETIPLVRPLLGVHRPEILGYCEGRGLDPILDETNSDPTFFRNRLRNELLPELETYNPRIRETLLRMARALEGENQVLQEAINEAWSEVLYEQGEGCLGMRRERFVSLSRGLQRNLVRRAIASLRPGLRDVDFKATERTVETILSPPRSGEADVLGGLSLYFEGDLLWLAEDSGRLPSGNWPQIDPDDRYELRAGGRVELAGDWFLEAEFVERSEAGLPSGPVPSGLDDQVWLDADRVAMPLQIRSRRPGDRFTPLGMGGRSQKLSDFMINERIPGRLRAGWPLVFSGGALVWVPGYRIAHPVRVRPETGQLVRLAVRQVSP